MIEVRNLVKKYGNHLAVDHLDFTIEAGRIYGFLGPNGAGKSTTMNIMTGYLGATEGEVLIDGHDILKEPEEAKKRIGYLPELPPLYMDMTVREYLQFAAELKGIPRQKRQEAITEVEKMVKIKDVERRLIKNLSKGYRQRVGLAQAVLGFPEIIILDEPSVGLDPKQIIEIRELIRQLAKRHTVILSSHILAEVREVCDYILIISKGKLVASDTPENLERMLGDADTIEIEAKAPQALTKEILKTIPGIEQVSVKASGEEGVAAAVIKEKKGEDVRESIFRTFAEKDVPLLALQTRHVSLEDVFMQLTQNESLPEALRRKDEREKVKLPAEEESTADALKEEEAAEEEKVPAADKRELKSYFQSMTGCVFIAFLLVFTGIYFMAYNLTAGYPYFSYTLSGSLIVFIVGIPLITMRSFSEERKNKTDQLLLTAPVSLGKVVMGKYLAMATVIAIPNVIFCLYPLIIKSQGTAYLEVDYISIAVFFLLGCVYAAIGMFLSSLTESQIIAFISTFGILLVLYLWDGLLSMLPSSAAGGLAGVLILLTIAVFYIWRMTENIVLAGAVEIAGAAVSIVLYFVKQSLYENLLTDVLGKLALANVFTDISNNSIVDVTGIVLYLSVIAVFVFLTVQAIQKRRWS